VAEPRKPGSRPTEAVNPRTRDLDRLAPRVLIERILDEDAGVPGAVRAALPELERASELLVRTLRGEGHWFNVGAGTSGRLGALDAAEIPPTYGLAPDRVQAVIAGGPEALLRAIEGAEDDTRAAATELATRGFSDRDVLVALSASGRTPYVLGAVEYARSCRAPTIGITCSPESPLARGVDVPIAVLVGPEVVSGSTRMKGGLAQKIILHTLSTSVMVRLGRVEGNLMTGIRAGSSKLRERALCIVMELSGRSPGEAQAALDASGGTVTGALKRLGRPNRG
jgi:N-acetylmuramic acid 6-phosphate etherase